MDPTVEETEFAGPHGPVPARIYRAADAADLAAGFVWNHGGGWIGGDLDMVEADSVARAVATALKGVVVSVEYRLAPDHVFPVPVDDVLAAFTAVHHGARELGIDVGRLGFGGASAGAHLAALATARLVADGPARRPVALVLVYPATDPLDGPYEPRPDDCPPEFWLGRTATVGLFRTLLGPGVDLESAARAPDGTTPARVALDGFPPTLVTTAGIDGLYAQAVRFVALLEAAGVDVVHQHEPWAYHGYLSRTGISKRTDAALARHVAWLRAALGDPC